MSRHFFAVILVAMNALWVAPAWAKSADDWLADMSRALRVTHYHGTVIYLSAGRVETLRVQHSFSDGVEREHWQALTGTKRELLRDDHGLFALGSGQGEISYQFSGKTRWSPALALAQRNKSKYYRSDLHGKAIIAGRAAQVVSVSALDQWRYSYRLWLDRETGLPLRIAVLDAQAEPLEQLAFSEISITPAVKNSLSDGKLARSGMSSEVDQVNVNAKTNDPDQATPAWRVLSLPPGFELRRSRQNEAGLQLLFSDGLASFSVYVENQLNPTDGESATRHGAVTARGFWRNGVRVVAVGKVPAITTERIARMICANPPKQ